MNLSNKISLKDSLTEKITIFAKDEKKRRNFDFGYEVFHPEYVTQCPRRLVYRSMGINSDENNNKRTIRASEKTIGKWLYYLSTMENVSIIEVNFEVSDIQCNVHGVIDIILQFENPDLKSICNIRDVDNETFNRIKVNGANRRDITYDMVYMWLSEIPNAIMIYNNIENDDFEILHLVPYNPLIKSAMNIFKTTLEYKFTNTLPDRPYENKNDLECTTCEFKKSCWKQN